MNNRDNTRFTKKRMLKMEVVRVYIKRIGTISLVPIPALYAFPKE